MGLSEYKVRHTWILWIRQCQTRKTGDGAKGAERRRLAYGKCKHQDWAEWEDSSGLQGPTHAIPEASGLRIRRCKFRPVRSSTEDQRLWECNGSVIFGFGMWLVLLVSRYSTTEKCNSCFLKDANTFKFDQDYTTKILIFIYKISTIRLNAFLDLLPLKN